MINFWMGVVGLILMLCVGCNIDGPITDPNNPNDPNGITEPDPNVLIDRKLAELKPLPKVHYFAPLSFELSKDRNSQRLYELARITHSLCVSGKWTTKEEIDNCVCTCAKVNKTNPAIQASLGINFSPWHRKFDPNLPPTDRGPTYWEEIDYFEERALLVKGWVEQSNKEYGSDVKISAILLDCERFHILEGDDLWNEAIRENLDIIHIKAQSIFPGARIEWYGRGIVLGNGWKKTSTWTGKEIKAPLSCSFYTLPEIQGMRETFRRTCELADELGIEDVTPYVALGAGYRRRIVDLHRWYPDWPYDIVYSYLIGAELNIKWYGDKPENYAPYNYAKIVSFNPPPFHPKTPDWARHFIAYVRGATGVKELKDLGYEDE